MCMTIFLLHNWIWSDTILGRLVLQEMKMEKALSGSKCLKLLFITGCCFTAI